MKDVEDIKINMGKIIDGFVMLHYIIKNIHNSKSYEEILKNYLNTMISSEGFDFDNAKLYFISDNIQLIKLEQNNLIFQTIEKLENPFITKALEKKDYQIYEDSKKVIIPLESQGNIIGVLAVENSIEISFEILKAIEIFAMQTTTILELVKLKSHLEEEIQKKTEKLEEANQKLLKYNENLEKEVEDRTKKLKSIQTQLIQQEKLASIGQLAAGVAHELNNPIGFVMGNFSALKNYFLTIKEFLDLNEDLKKLIKKTDQEKFNEILNKIDEYEKNSDLEFILDDIAMLFEESEEGINRVINIVKNLKEFSRIDEEKNENFNLNKGIENTLIVAKNEYKYCADIEKELADIPMIKANGGEINEVILNIIVNAAQAIKEMENNEKKVIQIKTYSDNNFIYCEITDNGPGIPENIISKVFDPFFTTKEPGKGTGLGLNIAYNIIKNKHNGEIEIDSKLGKGTTFKIKLPIT